MVFFCENNKYAISVPLSKQMAVKNVADRAEGYGFEGVVVEGNDVLACYEAIEGRRRARLGPAAGPTLIEFKTYRFHPHTSDDDDRTYRSREEVDEAQAQRPASCVFGELPRRSTGPRSTTPRIEADSRRGEGATSTGRSRRARGTPPDPEPDERSCDHVFFEARREMTEKNVVADDPRHAAGRR